MIVAEERRIEFSFVLFSLTEPLVLLRLYYMVLVWFSDITLVFFKAVLLSCVIAGKRWSGRAFRGGVVGFLRCGFLVAAFLSWKY